MAEGNEGMAYFLWLDEACDELVEQAEPDLLRAYNGVPVPVERFDICRIVVLKWFGGVVSALLSRIQMNRSWERHT